MDSLVFGELRRQRKGLRVWAKLEISVWPFEGFFQMVRGRETACSRIFWEGKGREMKQSGPLRERERAT